MFNWYNKNSPKNTITRYLSWKYTQQELTELTCLELPDNFESLDYANELAEILQDSPWKISEVKYSSSSLKSLKGVFTKEYWFGKKEKPADDTTSLSSETSEEETNSNQDLGESIYYDLENKSETNSVTSTNSETTTSESEESIKDLRVEEPNFSWKTPPIYTYEFLTDQAGIIFCWKAWTGTWQAPFLKGIYLDKERKYTNSWVKVQVCEKLPLLKLPEGVNCFFEPVNSQAEMIQKNYWTYCWIENSKELSNCANCSNYFLPEEKQRVCGVCAKREAFFDLWNLHRFTPEQKQDWLNVGFQENEANFCRWLRDVKRVSPEWVLNYGDQEELKKEHLTYLLNPLTTNWWENSQNLLILGGSLVVLGIILLNKD